MNIFVCYRDPELVIDNMLDNPDFHGLFEYVTYKEYMELLRIYSNYMSGDFASEQAVSKY